MSNDDTYVGILLGRNTKEESNGYVVFKLNICGTVGKQGGGQGGEVLFRPPPTLSTTRLWTDISRRRERFSLLFLGFLLHGSRPPLQHEIEDSGSLIVKAKCKPFSQ
jgi:hypothetical protein